MAGLGPATRPALPTRQGRR